MTSLAFVFGVLPLAVSTGAGAGGQNAIDRAVVGGMLSATIFAIFFVPMFFVIVARLFKHGQTDSKPHDPDAEEPHAGRVQPQRSEEHTSELQSLMRISYAVFCLKKKHKHKATQ